MITWARFRRINPIEAQALPSVTGCLMFIAAFLLGAATAAHAQSGAPGDTLYLLAGTTSGDAAATYAVNLYSVDAGKAEFLRQIFGPDQGMFDAREDRDGHIYVMDYWATRVSVIHEARPAEGDVVLFPGGLGKPGTRGNVSFYYPAWGVTSGTKATDCLLLPHLEKDGIWSITRVLADRNGHDPRVTTGSGVEFLAPYGSYQYSGDAGQPAPPTPPSAKIVDHKVALLALGGREVFVSLGDVPDRLIPQPQPSGMPGLFVNVLARTSDYLIVSAVEPSGGAAPTAVYVEGRASHKWSVISIPSIEPASRVFGNWLATSVEEPAVGHPMESPGVDNERAAGNLARPQPVPPTRLLYGLDGGFYMPGRLELDNLMDRRRITIETGQQDSQILNVDPGGNVLYRVNDKIYSAQIQGDRVGPSTLVVQGEDVPEVHWVFWSAAPPPSPSATSGPKAPSR